VTIAAAAACRCLLQRSANFCLLWQPIDPIRDGYEAKLQDRIEDKKWSRLTIYEETNQSANDEASGKDNAGEDCCTSVSVAKG
jgi:hypothetical protein